MTRRYLILLTFLAAGAPVHAWAQHEVHQPNTDEEASLAQCAQVQPVVQKLIDGASLRLEAARQSNSAAVLRAAVDDVDGALRDLRAQLVPCAKTQVIDPHTGHAMPILPAPAGTSAPPSTPPDPHEGHVTPAPTRPGAAKTPVSTQANDAQTIEQWLNGYDAAFLAKDLDRLATYYHPDVTIYEGAGVNNGWADYRDHHLGPELKAFENLEFGHSNRRVQMLGDRAAYVISEYFIKAKMKERMLDSVGRETLVVEKQGDGAWKIRHSHTSGRARPQA